MSKMSLPGFTAEASLGSNIGFYRVILTTSTVKTEITLAVLGDGGGGGPELRCPIGRYPCVVDCTEEGKGRCQKCCRFGEICVGGCRGPRATCYCV
ncbi:MAG: hypothetical protein ACREOW_10560 [Thermodesulfobacteriota bacterium]